MPSLDIVSQVDLQEADNAVNNVVKEVATRYDFRGVHTEIKLNRKDKVISIVTGDEMKIKALREMLIAHFTRRKLDSKCLEFKKHEATSQGQLKQDVAIKEGISKEMAQKIVKTIKNLKLKKVQPAIQDDQVRVTAKQIDDLQTVMQTLNNADFDLPLQFVNMKR
ncbi:YajQ family cyclic di-GMP-binding protein [Desulfobaculum sp. SPO524]|uniref:YajQ family cyclic di-GMP-binding protein n=1 Tax=Desulfobaculum sp. SPO524 TaxID=3378071 RepID=UPI003853E158